MAEKLTGDDYKRLYAQQDAAHKRLERPCVSDDEKVRRRSAGLKVWFPLTLSHRIFDTRIPLHHHKGYEDLAFDGREKCYLFPSIERIDAFAKVLESHDVVLERFEKGWRVK